MSAHCAQLLCCCRLTDHVRCLSDSLHLYTLKSCSHVIPLSDGSRHHSKASDGCSHVSCGFCKHLAGAPPTIPPNLLLLLFFVGAQNCCNPCCTTRLLTLSRTTLMRSTHRLAMSSRYAHTCGHSSRPRSTNSKHAAGHTCNSSRPSKTDTKHSRPTF
jgi:hypothetical protein